jgi:hypothetical protein
MVHSTSTASDKVYELLALGQWFSLGTTASSTTKTGCHDIAEILLKVALKCQKSNKKKLSVHLKSDLIIRVPSLDGDNLIVFYDLSAPEIWPNESRAYERAVHRYGTRRAKKGPVNL